MGGSGADIFRIAEHVHPIPKVRRSLSESGRIECPWRPPAGGVPFSASTCAGGRSRVWMVARARVCLLACQSYLDRNMFCFGASWKLSRTGQLEAPRLLNAQRCMFLSSDRPWDVIWTASY